MGIVATFLDFCQQVCRLKLMEKSSVDKANRGGSDDVMIKEKFNLPIRT